MRQMVEGRPLGFARGDGLAGSAALRAAHANREFENHLIQRSERSSRLEQAMCSFPPFETHPCGALLRVRRYLLNMFMSATEWRAPSYFFGSKSRPMVR